MDEKNRAIPRTVMLEFCRNLGYDPREVITVEATADAVSVTTMPKGVTGLEGITTVHKITDTEVQA